MHDAAQACSYAEVLVQRQASSVSRECAIVHPYSGGRDTGRWSRIFFMSTFGVSAASVSRPRAFSGLPSSVTGVASSVSLRLSRYRSGRHDEPNAFFKNASSSSGASDSLGPAGPATYKSSSVARSQSQFFQSKKFIFSYINTS